MQTPIYRIRFWVGKLTVTDFSTDDHYDIHTGNSLYNASKKSLKYQHYTWLCAAIQISKMWM